MKKCGKAGKTLLYCHDGPVYRDAEGHIYDYSLNRQTLDTYLELAERVCLVIRVKEKEPGKRMNLLDAHGLSVAGIEDIKNFRGMLGGFGSVRDQIGRLVREADYVIVRLPSLIGSLAAEWARRYGKPYMAECVHFAWDVYWHHSLSGKLAAPFFWAETRRNTAHASHVLYVTRDALQKRYPTKGRSLGCSDVFLQNVEPGAPEKYGRKKEVLVLGTAGSLDMAFKGQQYVIRALAELRRRGDRRFLYRLAGTGSGEKLLRLARKLGVEDQLQIDGCIPGSRMKDWYGQLDVYIQPSLTEGLSRALLEAQACGTASLGSDIPGNRELLRAKSCFPSGKHGVKPLAELLLGLDKDSLAARSEEGLEKASEYLYERIREKRKLFYQDYIKETEP